jgi:hypothetical protein
MSTEGSLAAEVYVKYAGVSILASPERDAPVIGELRQDQPFQVTHKQGLFYAVSLPDGSAGFVFGRNLAGDGLPIDEAQQAQAGQDKPAGTSVEPPHPDSLMGWVRRLTGRRTDG